MNRDDTRTGASEVGTIEDRWLQDPPKEKKRLEGNPELKAKIEALSEDLKEGEDWRNHNRQRGEPPKVITAGGLDEARAYVPMMEPAEHPEYATVEMRRVRIAPQADPRHAVTEVIERAPPHVRDATEDTAPGGEAGGDDREREASPRRRRWPLKEALLMLGAMSMLAGVVFILVRLLALQGSGSESDASSRYNVQPANKNGGNHPPVSDPTASGRVEAPPHEPARIPAAAKETAPALSTSASPESSAAPPLSSPFGSSSVDAPPAPLAAPNRAAGVPASTGRPRFTGDLPSPKPPF